MGGSHDARRAQGQDSSRVYWVDSKHARIQQELVIGDIDDYYDCSYSVLVRHSVTTNHHERILVFVIGYDAFVWVSREVWRFLPLSIYEYSQYSIWNPHSPVNRGM